MANKDASDGFTIGERLDMEIAKNADFIVMAFGEARDDAGNKRTLVANRGDVRRIARHLAFMLDKEKEGAAQVIGFMQDILDHTKKLSKYRQEGDAFVFDVNTEKDIDDDAMNLILDAFRDFMIDEDATGFYFFTGKDGTYGRSLAGVKGTDKTIVDALFEYGQRDVQNGITFIGAILSIAREIHRIVRPRIMPNEKEVRNMVDKIMKDFRDHIDKDRD